MFPLDQDDPPPPSPMGVQELEEVHEHMLLDEDFDDEEHDMSDINQDNLRQEFITEPAILTELRSWAIDTHTPLTHVSSLLTILNKHYGKPFPKDARTLLRTPRAPIVPIEMEPGQYYHYGREWTEILCSGRAASVSQDCFRYKFQYI